MTKSVEAQPSLDAIADHVSSIEAAVDNGSIPLAADESVAELQESLQHLVADAASELMTGVRWKRERQKYLDTYGVYRRLLGAVALDMANRTYDECGDTGNVKEDVFGYLQHAKRQLVALDYEKRLEKSSFERSKQWLAQHHKTRFAMPFALSGATTALLFKAGEASSSFIDMTPTQGGLMGIMTLMGSLAIRSTLRNGPRQAGEALKNQFNASLRTYMLEGVEKKRTENDSRDTHGLPEQYAERHLTLPFGAAAIYLLNHDVANKDEFQPMISGLLDITEASMHESYGIKVAKEKEPLGRRIAGQVLRLDLPA